MVDGPSRGNNRGVKRGCSEQVGFVDSFGDGGGYPYSGKPGLHLGCSARGSFGLTEFQTTTDIAVLLF